MKKLNVITVAILVLVFHTCSVYASVVGKEVEYQANGVKMKGYLAYDDAKKGKRPGVLVVHEWWGHNEYARERARMLAELGYTALVLSCNPAGRSNWKSVDSRQVRGKPPEHRPLIPGALRE